MECASVVFIKKKKKKKLLRLNRKEWNSKKDLGYIEVIARQHPNKLKREEGEKLMYAFGTCQDKALVSDILIGRWS